MFKKYETLRKIEEEKIIAVVRTSDVEKTEKCFDSLFKGGISVVEITFNVLYANTTLERLSKKYGDKMTIGAGTVLDSETARIAILAGAEFIVSPSFSEGVAKLCNRYSIPYLCGVNTPTEIAKAIEFGVDIVKLFPANSFSPSIIKDLKGPFPNVGIVPMGGVKYDNIAEWLNAGAFACGVCGDLINGYKTGDYESITETAKKYKELICKIK